MTHYYRSVKYSALKSITIFSETSVFVLDKAYVLCCIISVRQMDLPIKIWYDFYFIPFPSYLPYLLTQHAIFLQCLTCMILLFSLVKCRQYRGSIN